MRAPTLIPLLIPPLFLAACSEQTPAERTVAAVETAQREASEDDGAVPCARSGQREMRRECLIERTEGRDGLVLTMRHPDGAFRRLLVTKDGRGVVAADGAELATVTVLDPRRIEVKIAGDRYELPATVRAGAAAAQ